MMNGKKWIRTWFIIIIIIPTVGVFNYLIDPYGMNNFVKINRVNKEKTGNTGYTYRFKTNIVRNYKFDTLMLGTSRVGVMNPEVVNKYTNGNTFNFEVPGSITEQQYKLFLYTLKYNNIKTLVYGIDFMSFNENRTIKNDFKEFYKLYNKIDNKQEISNYDLYFNLKTFKESAIVLFKNILNKKSFEAKYLFKNGMRDYINHTEALKNGTFEIDKRIESSIKSYFKENTGTYKNYKFSYEYLKYFKKTIDYCRNNNIKVLVYIPPMYSAHFDAFNSAGYYDEFELFKKELVQITNYVDFTGHNTITENKNNYWDSSHLRKELTEVVMAKLFNDNLIQVPVDFGVYITKDNIDNHLENLKEQIQNYDLNKIK